MITNEEVPSVVNNEELDEVMSMFKDDEDMNEEENIDN